MKLFSWYSRIPLVWRNLGAFVLGCLAGIVLYKINQHCGGNFLENVITVLSPFGTVLVNMLKMIVIPIIFFSLIYGAASLPVKTFGDRRHRKAPASNSGFLLLSYRLPHLTD